jgi:enoyl-CoA hydratase/carnithine racemase
LLARAERAATALAEKPPAALHATKALMKKPQMSGVEQGMQAEAEQFRRLLVSPEAKEAFAAFLEKRKADFSKFS